MPTFLDGSLNTWNCSVFGSSIATVSLLISFAHMRPLPSMVTVYGPPFGLAGISYSVLILAASGSACAFLMVPLPLPVYQCVAPLSTTRPCGCAPDGGSHSLNFCVFV